MDIGQLQAVAGGSAVDRDLPCDAGVELEVEHEAAILKEQARGIALRDVDVASARVERDIRFATRIFDVSAIEILASICSHHRDLRAADVDTHARLLQ